MTTEKQWDIHPMPLGEAADKMLALFSEGSKRLVANTPKSLLSSFRLGWGKCIRNNLGLLKYYSDAPIPREAAQQYAERESALIMETMWEKLQADERYRDLLKDPNTGVQLPEEMRNIEFADYQEKKSYYDTLVEDFKKQGKH